jgi:hypothetical protein
MEYSKNVTPFELQYPEIIHLLKQRSTHNIFAERKRVTGKRTVGKCSLHFVYVWQFLFIRIHCVANRARNSQRTVLQQNVEQSFQQLSNIFPLKPLTFGFSLKFEI